MDEENTRVLLISANVGSVFEDPDQMFKPWMTEFTQCISKLEPGFVAIHCQEVGGKNYEASMQHVNLFVKIILGCPEMEKYDRARVFLDEDYTAVDKFTALGNLYFIHECVEEVSIWDFVECKFLPVCGREVLSGNIENIAIKEKAKFPQQFFPEFKWSRKGFLRTRWSINNCIFDLINIHLFHDASNIIAMESSPSLYSVNRQQALSHTLQRFENDNYDVVPFFMFGDFNFRLDTKQLVKALTTQTDSKETRGKKDQVNKIVYTEQGNGKVVLTLETKGFDYHEKHSDLFLSTSKWLHQFDNELSHFHGKLEEFDFSFPPSYPFSEDVNDGKSYMKTRCPSWCDRILYNSCAKDIILQNDKTKPCYDILGKDICMGDHKPVYLFFHMTPGKGNLNDSFDKPFEWQRKNTLSINGSQVETTDIDSINIHDYAVFENVKHLPLHFRTSIKSHDSVDIEEADEAKTNSKSKMTRNKSFQEAAREICQMEKIILMWKRSGDRHHSSSSEDFESDTEEHNTEPIDTQSVETTKTLNIHDDNNTTDHTNIDSNANTKQSTALHDNVLKASSIILEDQSLDTKLNKDTSATSHVGKCNEHVESSPTHDPTQQLVRGAKRSSAIKVAKTEPSCCTCVLL